MNLIFSIKKYCKSLGSMCYYLLYYVILETCIRKCLYVCLLVIHFNLWIQSSDYLYVVLPLITSEKRRGAKLDFKLQELFSKILILKFYFGPPYPTFGSNYFWTNLLIFIITHALTRDISQIFRTNLMQKFHKYLVKMQVKKKTNMAPLEMISPNCAIPNTHQKPPAWPLLPELM